MGCFESPIFYFRPAFHFRSARRTVADASLSVTSSSSQLGASLIGSAA